MKAMYMVVCWSLFCSSVLFNCGGFAQDSVVHSPSRIESEGLGEAIKKAVSLVTPALVRIHVVETYYTDGREMKTEASGSGVVITAEGHIITNHHVAGHAKQLKCIFADKSEYEAELVGTDALTDIAVIALKNKESRQFSTIKWGDSSTVQVGEHVLAMGSPLALSQSVTMGIISNTEMTMPEWISSQGGLTLDGENVGSLVRWLAHDAQIFGGNSGGPLVNLNGEVIGINEIRMGLSGAIPSNLARKIAEELIRSGKIRRAWIGIEVQPRLKSDLRNTGALINSVVPGSPAAIAGLCLGDLLIAVADTNIDIKFPVQLPDLNLLVADLPIGEKTAFTILRDGQTLTFDVIPIERELYEHKQFEELMWGITIRDISFLMAKERKRSTTDGVLVTSVRAGGPASDARPPISPDDVIVEIAGTPVKNVFEFRKITAKLAEEKSEPFPVLTVFERKNDRFLSVVKVGIRPIIDPGIEVKKAWLPVEYQVVTRDIAEALGDASLRGFRVTQVYPNTSAAEAGIQVGDIIVGVDGTPMTASLPEHRDELAALIRQYTIHDQIELELIRYGQRTNVSVTLSESPKLAREMKKYQDEHFEFTVRDITFFDRANEKWEQDQVGVLVEQVKPGGWAALGQLETGDLIVAIDGQLVTSVDTVADLMNKSVATCQPSVVFQVRRGIRYRYLELEPKWNSEKR